MIFEPPAAVAACLWPFSSSSRREEEQIAIAHHLTALDCGVLSGIFKWSRILVDTAAAGTEKERERRERREGNAVGKKAGEIRPQSRYEIS